MDRVWRVVSRLSVRVAPGKVSEFGAWIDQLERTFAGESRFFRYPHSPLMIRTAPKANGDFLAEYFDVVKSSLATSSNDCVDAVQKSFQQVEILLRHRIGQLSLNDKLR